MYLSGRLLRDSYYKGTLYYSYTVQYFSLETRMTKGLQEHHRAAGQVVRFSDPPSTVLVLAGVHQDHNVCNRTPSHTRHRMGSSDTILRRRRLHVMLHQRPATESGRDYYYLPVQESSPASNDVLSTRYKCSFVQEHPLWNQTADSRGCWPAGQDQTPVAQGQHGLSGQFNGAWKDAPLRPLSVRESQIDRAVTEF